MTVQVSGRYIALLVQSAGNVSRVFEKRTLEMLEEHGLEEPDPEEWYPMDEFVEVMQGLKEKAGPTMVKEAGEVMGKESEWPPSVNTPTEALEALTEMHESIYRNYDDFETDVGRYLFESTGPDSGEVRVDPAFPYPIEAAEGVVSGTVETFADGAAFIDVTETAEGGYVLDVEW